MTGCRHLHLTRCRCVAESAVAPERRSILAIKKTCPTDAESRRLLLVCSLVKPALESGTPSVETSK